MVSTANGRQATVMDPSRYVVRGGGVLWTFRFATSVHAIGHEIDQKRICEIKGQGKSDPGFHSPTH